MNCGPPINHSRGFLHQAVSGSSTQVLSDVPIEAAGQVPFFECFFMGIGWENGLYMAISHIIPWSIIVLSKLKLLFRADPAIGKTMVFRWSWNRSQSYGTAQMFGVPRDSHKKGHFLYYLNLPPAIWGYPRGVCSILSQEPELLLRQC